MQKCNTAQYFAIPTRLVCIEFRYTSSSSAALFEPLLVWHGVYCSPKCDIAVLYVWTVTARKALLFQAFVLYTTP